MTTKDDRADEAFADAERIAKSRKARRLALAEDAIFDAVHDYRRVLAEGPTLDSTEITYAPSTGMIDGRQFKMGSVNAAEPFSHDVLFSRVRDGALPPLQTLLLSFSPHWEDRIRASVLQAAMSDEITLPDGFPCIYEPADSPTRAGALRPQPFVWVSSPDEAMLRELLPLYQDLWASYEDQWPHTPNRTFTVGRLDDVSPHGVYRPETTPAQVIGQTMLVHTGMYRTAPQHLKEMHPLYPQWTKTRIKNTNTEQEVTP